MSSNLIISRDYVKSDTLTDFTFEEKFFKLPIDKYVNKITDINAKPITLTPPQIALVNAVQNPIHRAVVACFSRRVGKTYGANWIANILSLEPNKSILIISPNYSLSQISFDIQLNLFTRFEIKLLKKNMKDRVILLENNTSIRMTSANQVNSAIGRSYDLIIFDEAAIDGKLGTAFNMQLRPTLDKMNSKVIFISTPRGDNYFKEFYDRGFSSEYPEWVSMWCSWKANPRASEEDIEQARRSISKAEFAQEYEASFSALEGQIYDFDFDNCVINYDEDYRNKIDLYDTIMGLDLGFRDPTAFVVVATDEHCAYIIDEYLEPQRKTSEHAKDIQYAMGVHDVDFVYIDHAAAQTKYDLSADFDIACVNANKSIENGLSYVASLIDNKRLFVDKSCTQTLEMLLNYRWDPRENLVKEKPLHDKYSHIADAVRYALYSHSANLSPLGEQ